MSGDPVWDAVVTWVKKTTSLPVIKDRSSGVVPYRNYLLVNKLSMDRTTENNIRVWTTEREVDGEMVIEHLPDVVFEWVFSVTAECADTALGQNALVRLQNAASMSVSQEPLWPAYRIQRTSIIRYIPTFINEAWERKSQMDVFIHGKINDVHQGYVIEQFEFDFNRT